MLGNSGYTVVGIVAATIVVTGMVDFSIATGGVNTGSSSSGSKKKWSQWLTISAIAILILGWAWGLHQAQRPPIGTHISSSQSNPDPRTPAHTNERLSHTTGPTCFTVFRTSWSLTPPVSIYVQQPFVRPTDWGFTGYMLTPRQEFIVFKTRAADEVLPPLTLPIDVSRFRIAWKSSNGGVTYDDKAILQFQTDGNLVSGDNGPRVFSPA